MRPVGAPDDPVRPARHQRVGERHRVGIGQVPLGRDAIGAAQLHPAIAVGHAVEEATVARMVDPESHRHVAQMADRERHRQAAELVHVGLVDMQQQLDVPAQRLQPLGDAAQLGERLEGIAARIGDVDADAAGAPLMHGLELGIGDAGADRNDGAQAVGMGADIVERGAVVGAVDAGLGDDPARDAEHLVQMLVGRGQRIRRRVAARRRPRIGRRRAEDMGVAVAGIGRHRELGLARRRIGSRAGLLRDDRHRGGRHGAATAACCPFEALKLSSTWPGPLAWAT